MTRAIEIPKLGLTMEEGTIVDWFRADGERVEKGQPLFAVETDKIVSDIEAEQSGYLQRVAPLNEPLPVGALVGYLHASAEAALAAAAGGGAAPAAVPAVAAVAQSARPVQAAAPAAAHPAVLQVTGASGRILVSPVARRLAAERGVQLGSIAGSGPGGVILKRDVPAAAAVPAPTAPRREAQTAPPLSREPVRRPMTSLRRAVAQRMMKSLAGTAQMTGFGKVDMTEAVRLRRSLIAAADRLGARITITDLALKAAATVLAEMPEINSSIDGNDIVTWGAVHIGLAVALDDGLIVPVIRDVDRLTLPELSRERAALIEKARSGRLNRDEIEGATFTLSNFGSYGGDFETPILNPPQSALLGIGQVTDEPAVRGGEIVIRSMMTMSLTFDHRLIDGAVAGRFRARFKALLEDPVPWLVTLR